MCTILCTIYSKKFDAQHNSVTLLYLIRCHCREEKFYILRLECHYLCSRVVLTRTCHPSWAGWQSLALWQDNIFISFHSVKEYHFYSMHTLQFFFFKTVIMVRNRILWNKTNLLQSYFWLYSDLLKVLFKSYLVDSIKKIIFEDWILIFFENIYSFARNSKKTFSNHGFHVYILFICFQFVDLGFFC